MESGNTSTSEYKMWSVNDSSRNEKKPTRKPLYFLISQRVGSRGLTTQSKFDKISAFCHVQIFRSTSFASRHSKISHRSRHVTVKHIVFLGEVSQDITETCLRLYKFRAEGKMKIYFLLKLINVSLRNHQELSPGDEWQSYERFFTQESWWRKQLVRNDGFKQKALVSLSWLHYPRFLLISSEDMQSCRITEINR